MAGFLGGIVFSGCATKPYSPLAAPAPARIVPSSVESSPEIVVLPHEPAPVIGLDNVDGGPPPAIMATNSPPAFPPRVSFGPGWIPLRVWSERCALGKPERSIAGNVTSYRITTQNGLCKMTIGSRLAQWNGINVWLGFAPQLVRGEPHIHALDAEKTFLPLAETPVPRPLVRRTIVLDPGHGGADSGTRSAQNQLEKNYALDWALRTERLLTNAGWKVFLTRRSDVDMSLAERIMLADRVQADLFISLHFNSTFPQTQASGIETYCLTPNGMPSTLARGFADDERALFPNNTFDGANAILAYRIQRALVAETGEHDDGLKRARFMGVLRYQNRPAVLVEGGFLSNTRDTANINSVSYRESLAKAVTEALK
jgi:N-acetylmuramoyl-L-alanine amidase